MDSLMIVFKIILIFNVLCDYGSYGTPVNYNNDLSDITRYAGQYDIRSGNYFVIRYKKDGKASDFSYDHENPNSPDKWSDFAPECGGKSQSPINIKTTSTKKAIIPAKMSATKWSEKPIKIEVENNGHTVKFEFEYKDGKWPEITLNNIVYVLVQLHYHFGQNKKSGSEHLINNRGYSMEGHAVLFNRDYGTFENALKYENGIAVLAKFFEIVEKPATIKMSFDFLNNVREPDQKFIINQTKELFSMQDIFGPASFSHFSYQGSLTTPSCNEVVSWYLAEKPMGISSKNVLQFRKLNGHEGKMAPNFRPVQPRNGRTIFYYKV